MDQIIFRYPGQKFVGIATRKTDGTLAHQGYILIDAIPKKGATLFQRPVLEVLTEEKMLKEISLRAANTLEAVAVLGAKLHANI
jgi:lipoate-protein ligase A